MSKFVLRIGALATLALIVVVAVLPTDAVNRRLIPFTYWWLRIAAVGALLFLLYEAREVSAERMTKARLVLDITFVIPLYMTWLLIWLNSNSPI